MQFWDYREIAFTSNVKLMRVDCHKDIILAYFTIVTKLGVASISVQNLN